MCQCLLHSRLSGTILDDTMGERGGEQGEGIKNCNILMVILGIYTFILSTKCTNPVILSTEFILVGSIIQGVLDLRQWCEFSHLKTKRRI